MKSLFKMETIAEEEQDDKTKTGFSSPRHCAKRSQVAVKKEEPADDLFALCDRVGKGYVIVEDLQKISGDIGLTVDQVGVVFAHLDKDCDGRLTAEEFRSGLELFLRQSTASEYVLRQLVSPEISRTYQQKTAIQKRSPSKSISEVLGLLSDKEAGPKFWNMVQFDHPELMPYLEDFIRVFAKELDKMKQDNDVMHASYQKRSISYEKYIQALYEEMENEIRKKDEEIRLKGSELEKHFQQRLNETHDDLMAAKNLKSSCYQLNEKLLKEKDTLKRDLEYCRRKLDLLKEELEMAKEDRMLSEKQNNIDAATHGLLEKFALERNGFDEQLTLLRSINERLADKSDELAASAILKDLVDFRVVGTTLPTSTTQSSRLDFKRGSIVINYCGHPADNYVDDDIFIDAPKVIDRRDSIETCLVRPNNHRHSDNTKACYSSKSAFESNGLKYESAPVTSPNYDVKQPTYKVILIGDSAVGKTSLINKMCNLPFRDNVGSTIGVDFHEHRVKCGDREIILQLWDTAGQERFRSITNQYMRRSDAVLIVYDVTSQTSFLNTSAWMASLENTGIDNKDVVVLLVGNKIDSECRFVHTADGEKLAKDTDALFFETSARTGDGILDLTFTLGWKLIDKCKHDVDGLITSLDTEVSTEAPKSRFGNCC